MALSPFRKLTAADVDGAAPRTATPVPRPTTTTARATTAMPAPVTPQPPTGISPTSPTSTTSQPSSFGHASGIFPTGYQPAVMPAATPPSTSGSHVGPASAQAFANQPAGATTPQTPQAAQKKSWYNPPGATSTLQPGGFGSVGDRMSRSEALRAAVDEAFRDEPSAPRGPRLPGGVPSVRGVQFSNIDPESDLRSQAITAGNDPRLAGTQGNVDAAADELMTGTPREQLERAAGEWARSLMGSGQLSAGGVGTDVQADRLNPDIAYNRQNTDVHGRSINPNVGFRRLNGTIATGSLDPNISAPGVETDAQFRRTDPNVAGRSLDPNVRAGASVMPAESERYRTLGGQQDSAVGNLTTGPNRTDLAAKAFEDLMRQTDTARTRESREIGRNAAALGRIGSGMVNTDLADLETAISQQRTDAARGLARDVAEGDIADRYNTVNTLSGLRGQEYGLDSAMRGEQRTERDYTTGLDERNVARQFDDRDYQTGLDERNYARGTEQNALELAALERNLARRADERDTMMGLSERNYGRAADDRAFTTGLDERNFSREAGERDTELGLSERNLGRDFANRDFETGLAADNISRGFNERAYGDSLAADNYGRGSAERSFRANLDADNLDRQRGERDFQYGVGRDNANAQMERALASLDFGSRTADSTLDDRLRNLGAMQGLEDQQYGQGLTSRNEMRGEREFQDRSANNAIDRRVQEAQLEEFLRNGEFARDTAIFDRGYADDPSQMQALMSQLYGDDAEATFGDVAGGQREDAYGDALSQYPDLVQDMIQAEVRRRSQQSGRPASDFPQV